MPMPSRSKKPLAAASLAAWILLLNRVPALAAERVREGLAGPGPLAAPASERPVHHYQLPPGPLGEVIAAFEAASGFKVTSPLDAIRDLPSPGVSGDYTAAQALRKLLESTGVT